MHTGCGRDRDRSGARRRDEATADSGGGEAATGSRLDQGGVGELENVCQDGEPGPATEVGLTDDEIHLGTVTDKGAAERPGLTQEMYDAAVAFAAWCNEHGGIGGRTVVVDDLDAKLFEYNQRVGEACQQDFALAAWFISHGTRNPLQQRDAIVWGCWG